MIYVETMNSSNEFFRFTQMEEVITGTGIALSSENIQLLTSRIQSDVREGKSVDVMFFNRTFADYHLNVFQGMRMKVAFTIAILILSAIMVGAYSAVLHY
jgi:hypothetical protein